MAIREIELNKLPEGEYVYCESILTLTKVSITKETLIAYQITDFWYVDGYLIIKRKDADKLCTRLADIFSDLAFGYSLEG